MRRHRHQKVPRHRACEYPAALSVHQQKKPRPLGRGNIECGLPWRKAYLRFFALDLVALLVVFLATGFLAAAIASSFLWVKVEPREI
jgi:hypothetical protein